MREKLLEKLAKLKAMADCPTGNENEVKAAAARMAEFMVRHGIEMAEIDAFKGNNVEDEIDSLISEQFFKDQKNVSTWQDILIAGLTSAYQCRCVTHTSKAWRGKQYKVYGHESNVKALEYVLAYCMRQVERFCDAWTNYTGYTDKGRRTSYKAGLASGICLQVQESVRKVKEQVAQNNERGLVLYEGKKQEVNNWVENMFKLGKPSARSIKNAEIFAQGRETGKNIDLNLSGPKKGLNPGKKALPYG